MGTVMTLQTGASVAGFLEAVEPERRRREGHELSRILGQVTGFEPRMWGAAIVGFGRYAYRYDSGHSGQSFMTGFSPREAALSIYVMPGFGQYEDHLARLGPHRHSVSCLYVTTLDAIDTGVLGEIVTDSVQRMKELHPGWSPA